MATQTREDVINSVNTQADIRKIFYTLNYDPKTTTDAYIQPGVDKIAAVLDKSKEVALKVLHDHPTIVAEIAKDRADRPLKEFEEKSGKDEKNPYWKKLKAASEQAGSDYAEAFERVVAKFDSKEDQVDRIPVIELVMYSKVEVAKQKAAQELKASAPPMSIDGKDFHIKEPMRVSK